MTKTKTNQTKQKLKGGCGCSSQQPGSFFSGGGSYIRQMKGGVALGPATYDAANSNAYPIFDSTADPTNPSAIVDARQLPNITGGKRRIRKTKGGKTKKTKRRNSIGGSRKRRIYKGGQDPILQHYNQNLITSGNTVIGAYTGADIVTANTSDLAKPFVTPHFL